MALVKPKKKNTPTNDRNAAGIDIGSTLTKISITDRVGKPSYQFISSEHVRNLKKLLENIPAERIGLTGAGAYPLKDMFPSSLHLNEFRAWNHGFREIAKSTIKKLSFPLLLSVVGTGTALLRLDSDSFYRAGGTALGGGTLLGLGKALTGISEFHKLVALASKGSREKIDLQVRDIYGEREMREVGLTKSVTASNLAKLSSRENLSIEDRASGLIGLIGENIALIASHLARSEGLKQIFYAGSTLTNNEPLTQVLLQVSEALGISAEVLESGEYSGAVGARLLALEQLNRHFRG
jgi:type II pantothenate kinase